MLIILEGVDGAGKSTLAQGLARALATKYPKDKVEVWHAGPPTKHPLDEYELPLVNYRPGTDHHIICDRWHLGEVVYPPVLGRESLLTRAAYWHIELYLKRLGAMVVWVDAPLDVLRQRVETDGDWLIKVEQLKALQDGYRSVCAGTNGWARELPVHHWMLNDSIQDIIQRAVIFEHRYVHLNHYVTYLGPRNPTSLLLGDTRGKLNLTDSMLPAFVPYPATSGHYLLNALWSHGGGDDALGIANACDVDNPEPLWLDLGRPRVVVLGNNARDAVPNSMMGSCSFAPHPQFMRRFRHHEERAYAREILE